MGIFRGPNIVTSGLALYLDSANTKSYPGTGTTIQDLSGKVNTGTLVNGVGFNASNNGSLVFDGVNDYVITPSYSSITSVNTPHSMISWIYSTSNVGASGILNIGEWDDDNYASGIILLNGVFYWSWNGAPDWIVPEGYNISSGYAIDLNTWYHLSISRSSTAINLYVNGILVKSESNGEAGDILPGPIMIGISSQGGVLQGYFPGRIATAQLFERELTAVEILQNYNATKGRFGL